jgi:DMSO/TMAO reductase YedYZ heme-binding membrane subunit
MILVGAVLFGSGTSVDAWRLAARLTARFSLFIFLIAFLAGPLARIFASDATRLLLRERRGIGLAFAGAHTVHLGTFLIYFARGGIVPPLFVVIPGVFGYFLLALMAATSNNWSVAKLGPTAWGRIHRFGIYYLWLIFLLTYLSRAAKGPLALVDVGLLSVLLGAFVLRLAVPLVRRLVGRAAPIAEPR